MGKAKHKKRKPLWKKAITATLALTLFASIGVASTAFYAKEELEANITTEPLIQDYVRPVKKEEFAGALNILVMGSDSREGANGVGIGGDTPGLSDTAILLHVAADRSFAYGVSIPRDSMVDRPACPYKDSDGIAPAETAMFNSAYAVGGAPCTVKTIETLTGVPVDHFMVVDFSGFRAIVDTIGGVEICLPEPVNDPIGKIYLDEGRYVADGKTALDYVRVRHGLGAETGDIGRMKRQQAFASSLITQILDDGIVENPLRTYQLAQDVTKTLTTDEKFANLEKLSSLALDLKKVGVKNISFITVPWEPWIYDANRVAWTEDASIVWNAMKEDKRLTPAILKDAIAPEKTVKKNKKKTIPVNNETYGLC